MANDQPTSLPEWASGGSAPIAEPPSASKQNGWSEGYRPPHEWFNWWMNLVYLWVTHFKKAVGFYDDLAVACTDMALGDTAIVWEDDAGVRGAIVNQRNMAYTPDGTASPREIDIDTCGDLVVFCGGDNHPVGVDRTLNGLQSGGTPTVTYTRTHTGQVCTKIKTNGTYTVVSNGRYIECFNATTGASVWEKDCGSSNAALDLCIQGARVYAVTLDTSAGTLTASRQLHAIALSTGTIDWAFDHDAALLAAVCSDGERIFIGGAASGFATTANIRALNTSGQDATGEGNNGQDASGVSWDVVLAANVGSGMMCCDGNYVFVGRATNGSEIECLAAGDGSRVWIKGTTPNSQNPQCVFCDQDFVYVATSDGGSPCEGFLEARNKHTGALVWRYAYSAGSADHEGVAAGCSDGQGLFIVSADQPHAFRIDRGNVPVRMRRVNPLVTRTRYAARKLQPEAQ